MKPRNFPARKLKRKLSALGKVDEAAMESARQIRTKKRRAT